MEKIINNRTVEHNCSDIFPKRWSPRAMSGEKISDEELNTLFEATRWAPSAYNEQPWRFLFAKKDTDNWNLFFNLLAEPNKAWCKNASVLVVIVAKKNFTYNNNPNKSYQFDCGSAWENLALQASSMNIVSHGMVGFDFAKAKEELNVPDDFEVLAMIAVGKPGRKEELPEKIRAMEFPNERKKVNEIIFEGKFK